MARLPAKELTERELQIMHVFWRRGETTAQDIQEALRAQGLELAYTTVATLVRILVDKGQLIIAYAERPFRYRPAQPYEKVSGRLLKDLVDRVFHGSRKNLLLRLLEDEPMPPGERRALEKLLQEVKS